MQMSNAKKLLFSGDPDTIAEDFDTIVDDPDPVADDMGKEFDLISTATTTQAETG